MLQRKVSRKMALGILGWLMFGMTGTAQETEALTEMKESFPIIQQLPELPTGCEITALTMVLQYYGLDADKITMAEKYLPCLSSIGIYEGRDGKLYGNNMNQYFIGNPESAHGIICGTGAIVTAARKSCMNGLMKEFP